MSIDNRLAELAREKSFRDEFSSLKLNGLLEMADKEDKDLISRYLRWRQRGFCSEKAWMKVLADILESKKHKPVHQLAQDVDKIVGSSDDYKG